MAKNYVTIRGQNNFTPKGNMQIKDEPVTPNESFDSGNFDNMDNDSSRMRKSLSLNDIAGIKDDLMHLDFESSNKTEVYRRYQRPTSSVPQELSRTKFVSMAEAIYHYERDTPERFRSTRISTLNSHRSTGPTVPESPMLRCKQRFRPVHAISQKEKELIEFEEQKKYKIRALPIPKSVIEGSQLPEVPKKPLTIPEPFKLTEIDKKPVSPDPQPVFKARPAPKYVLEKAHMPYKPALQVTKPISPKLHYNKRCRSVDRINQLVEIKPKSKSTEKARQGPIRPEPFSFEKRDVVLKLRREERIKRVIEEERKQASQFKAKPVPGVVKKAMHVATEKIHKCSSSTTSSDNKENCAKFEARPPTVLYKEPFKPVLKENHVVKSAPFDLNTIKRAVEREKFDQQLKAKEAEQERQRQEREKENKKLEDKKQAELRAKMVHHPKVVPKMSPFVPEKSKIHLTIPETPKLLKHAKRQL